MIHKACMPVYMNSGKIVADGTGGKIEGSTRGPRGPKKKMKGFSTLSHFKGLMRECQKEYLVHLVLKGQFQRISRRSWVTERLTARCRSNGQFAIPLISDIDLQQFLDTWPRNMERNICQRSDNMLLNNQYL